MDSVMEAITKEFKFGTLEFGSKFDYCGRTITHETEGMKCWAQLSLVSLAIRSYNQAVYNAYSRGDSAHPGLTPTCVAKVS